MSVRIVRGVPALVIALGLSVGCSSSADSTGDSGSTGGSAGQGFGGSTAAGGGTTYAPPRCDQTCQDYLVAHGLNDTVWFLWNQNVAGRPSGMTSKTGTCSLSGTFTITGTDSVASNGITTTDMVFDLQACEHSGNLYSLALTGAVEMVGSFDSAQDFAALTFSASPLVASGELQLWDNPKIDQSCPVSFAQDGIGNGTLTGQVCGRKFNSKTAFDSSTGTSGGAGSSSTGGTSAGGGSSLGGSSGTGADCRCYCPDNSDCTGASSPNPCGVDADGIPEPCGCPVGCH